MRCGNALARSQRGGVRAAYRESSKLAVLPIPSRHCGGGRTPALPRRHSVLLLCAGGIQCVGETRSRCGDAHAARRDSTKDAFLTAISRLARPPLRLIVLEFSCPNARPNDTDDEEPTTPTMKNQPSANHDHTAQRSILLRTILLPIAGKTRSYTYKTSGCLAKDKSHIFHPPA